MDSPPENLSGLVKELELASPSTGPPPPRQYVIPASDGQEELVITLLEETGDKKKPASTSLSVTTTTTAATAASKSSSSSPAGAVGDFQFLKPLNVINSIDKDGEIKGEGEAIMANITGFGQQAPLMSHSPEIPVQMSTAKPYVRIIEQPAGNKLRFRYKCEGRSAGALQGENSSAENKTYPTIQIVGYKGPVVVVVSCVEEKPPYRTHPHNLVGRDGICKKGVCSMDINNEEMICQFQNLGIQCVRKKDAPESLTKREQIRVDPFKQGFAHKNSSINLNAVRLCFQAFLKIGKNVPLTPLDPVVSNVIKDRKSHTDLQIIDYSDDSSPVEGGKKILIFTERVSKDDIEIHFTQQTTDGTVIWKEKGDFGPTSVHKQYAISFLTPAYYNKDIKEPVRCSMYLYKPSEQTISDYIDFTYYPTDYEIYAANRIPTTITDNATTAAAVSVASKKRAKPPGNRDELSSDHVLGPQKIPTAQLRHGGGHMTVIDNASPQQHLDLMLSAAGGGGGGGSGGGGGGTGTSTVPPPASSAPATTEPRPMAKPMYRQRNSSLEEPQAMSPSGYSPRPTGGGGYEQVALDGYGGVVMKPSPDQQSPYNHHQPQYQQLYTPQQQQQQQQQQQHHHQVVDDQLQGTSLDNVNISDLVDIRLNDLSANMDSSLIIQGVADATAENERNMNIGKPMYNSQSSQLQTPEVSASLGLSCSDSAGNPTKRNDLNKL